MKYKILEKVMNDYGRDLAADLERTVPVKTGALKNSINFTGLKPTSNGYTCNIEALYYFEFLDQGTKFIVPRHYLQASKNRLSIKYNHLISQAIAQDIKITLIKELK